MKKKAKIYAIEPSKAHVWTYRHADGEVAIYVPSGEPITLERANYLLSMAHSKLLTEPPV